MQVNRDSLILTKISVGKRIVSSAFHLRFWEYEMFFSVFDKTEGLLQNTRGLQYIVSTKKEFILYMVETA